METIRWTRRQNEVRKMMRGKKEKDEGRREMGVRVQMNFDPKNQVRKQTEQKPPSD